MMRISMEIGLHWLQRPGSGTFLLMSSTNADAAGTDDAWPELSEVRAFLEGTASVDERLVAQ